MARLACIPYRRLAFYLAFLEREDHVEIEAQCPLVLDESGSAQYTTELSYVPLDPSSEPDQSSSPGDVLNSCGSLLDDWTAGWRPFAAKEPHHRDCHSSVKVIHQTSAGLIVVMSKSVLLTEVEAAGHDAIENVVKQWNDASGPMIGEPRVPISLPIMPAPRIRATLDTRSHTQRTSPLIKASLGGFVSLAGDRHRLRRWLLVP
ncbi:hypothetical protein F5888DRAFT_1633394 [Russula emetica]|nr:hypothetical protein F5888DRAFT_1633394 [Russula emetica]